MTSTWIEKGTAVYKKYIHVVKIPICISEGRQFHQICWFLDFTMKQENERDFIIVTLKNNTEEFCHGGVN